jgi:hypothetical protein
VLDPPILICNSGLTMDELEVYLSSLTLFVAASSHRQLENDEERDCPPISRFMLAPRYVYRKQILLLQERLLLFGSLHLAFWTEDYRCIKLRDWPWCRLDYFDQ